MIGKKAPNPKKSSSKAGRVGALTAYITNPELKNGHEKCIHYEASNFITDDLQSQTLEMIALSHEAVRSKDPIDHYVLSWQEGEKPTIEQAREAVQLTLKHLGLEGHQVIWAVHADTDNMHVHIEVNRVHPETFKVVEINKGFQRNAIQQAAAIVEKVQGWKVHDKARFKTDELGHLITDSKTKLPQVFKDANKPKEPTGPAKDKEIQTGEKSAQRIGIEHAPAIIASAKSWADLHTKMQAAGMEYMRQGSGAAIKVGDTVVKASDVVDRKSNFGALQKRFGLYQTPNQPEIKNDHHERTQLIDDDRFSTGYEQPNTTPARLGTFHTMRNMPSRNLASSQPHQTKTENANLLQSDESADRGRSVGMRRRGNSNSTEARAGINETGERGPAGQQSRSQSIQKIAEKGEGSYRTRERTGTSGGRSEISVGEQERQRTAGSINTGANRSTERGSRREGKERDISTQANKQREKGPKPSSLLHERRRERLNDKQTGLEQYQQIKKDNDLAKSAERLALQKRHDSEKAELKAAQKIEREALLEKVPKGNGAKLNLMRGVIADVQRPVTHEQQERHKAEREALQAKYKPLPSYKPWAEQPQIVSERIQPIAEQYKTRDTLPPHVSQIIKQLTQRVDEHRNFTYSLDKTDVFRDEGKVIKILDLNSDAGIAAALATAQQKFGNVLTLTGSPEFQQNAVAVAVNNNLTCRFSDPALDKLRDELQQQKYKAEREAAGTERERQAAEQLEKLKKPDKVTPVPDSPPSNNQEVPDPRTPVSTPIQQPAKPGTSLDFGLQTEAALATAKAQAAAEAQRSADHLDDIHKQINAAKAEADPASKLALSTTAEADHAAPGHGVIIASNDQFVAVQTGVTVQWYRTLELTKNLKYDGIDNDQGRFAPGNELTRKTGIDGMRTLVTEHRQTMQTEATRKRESDRGRGY